MRSRLPRGQPSGPRGSRPRTASLSVRRRRKGLKKVRAQCSCSSETCVKVFGVHGPVVLVYIYTYIHTPFRRFAQILFLFFYLFCFSSSNYFISIRKSLSIIYRVRCTHAHTSVASRLVLNKECSRKVHRCDALPSCRYSIFCMCAAAAAAASCCTFQAPLCVCELHIYMLTRACSICTTALLFSFYELRLLRGKLVRSFEGRGFST